MRLVEPKVVEQGRQKRRSKLALLFTQRILDSEEIFLFDLPPESQKILETDERQVDGLSQTARRDGRA